ncbi:hypothetical protein LT679_00345 [Mucilaginibacter roseus]|uniref:Uncharacterized protein n=1 Tax=Mucilaginibacter roseus TaxID=1528868 RepID=A0ABS8TZF1_9SPHI|nr:hypothetical protein [Mucilaginibacter roseus]MCD8739034.1 hypothetical protein [Mucilaginibacter roseus]
MGATEYDYTSDERINIYESTFFHMYLKGESPVLNNGYKDVSVRDYASFIHEYVHYLQQITTPYGIKYNRFFLKNLLLFREFIDAQDMISVPVVLSEIIPAAQAFESELRGKNGSRNFSEGNIGDIEISQTDLDLAKAGDTAVNVGVYDFDNERVFPNGFQFGYTCVIESMAHLVQSLINPDLHHGDIPYKSAQLICNRLRPDIKDDTRLLIAICYTALYFNNPGHAFIMILKSVDESENGIDLYKRYMRDYSRIFNGQDMPNYRMMHTLMDDFVNYLEQVLGNKSVYVKKVIENCKNESCKGDSFLLNAIYKEDLSSIKTLDDILNFYGLPAIDSNNSDIVIPLDHDTNKGYTETASLLSLELITKRFLGRHGKVCIRYPICNRVTRENGKNLINDCCADLQWKKELPCLMTVGLSYWRIAGKVA